MAQTRTGHQDALRERVLQYALGEMMSRGVKRVKVDEIAADLQMSKRTLYEMFGDKENLLVECLSFHYERQQQEYRRLAEQAANPLEAYALIFNSRVDELRQMNPLFVSECRKYDSVQRMVAEQAEERGRHAMSFVQQCVDGGWLRSDVNYELALRIFDIVGRAVMEQELYREYGMEEVMRTLGVTQLRGLCTAKGLAVLESGIMRNGSEVKNEK